jgi:hypothetical protein
MFDHLGANEARLGLDDELAENKIFTSKLTLNYQRTVNFGMIEKEKLNNFLALGKDHIHCFHKYWGRLLGLLQV